MIVLCETRKEHNTIIVTVLPITHTAPADATSAIEIPRAIKMHLGLDDARSWIVVAEGNEFIWPGYDMRKIPNSDAYTCGFLPPRFFDQIVEAVTAFHKAAKLKLTPRD